MFEFLEYTGFYGEMTDGQSDYFYYCEELTSRSERYNWIIQPHRHKRIHQLFVVLEGGAQAQLEDRQISFDAPCLISIPEGQMHGFNWQTNSAGYVMSVTAEVFSELWLEIESESLINDTVLVVVPEEQVHELEHLCISLKTEEKYRLQYKNAMLLALLKQLVIHIARLAEKQQKRKELLSKPESKYYRFRSLVRQHAATHHQVNWYADKIGVSSSHLNQICQRQTQAKALEIIHRFLASEAKRFLMFADLNVSTIADELGFNDPAHFSKFFKKNVGISPIEYRQEHRVNHP